MTILLSDLIVTPPRWLENRGSIVQKPICTQVFTKAEDECSKKLFKYLVTVDISLQSLCIFVIQNLIVRV